MWKGRIRFSNEPKGSTLINSNSFVTSLRRAIEQENFATYLPEERADIIDSFWQGIGRALPECFKTPDEYNISEDSRCLRAPLPPAHCLVLRDQVAQIGPRTEYVLRDIWRNPARVERGQPSGRGRLLGPTSGRLELRARPVRTAVAPVSAYCGRRSEGICRQT